MSLYIPEKPQISSVAAAGFEGCQCSSDFQNAAENEMRPKSELSDADRRVLALHKAGMHGAATGLVLSVGFILWRSLWP